MQYREVTCYEFEDGSLYRTKEEAEDVMLDVFARRIAGATPEQLAHPSPDLAEALQGLNARVPSPDEIAARNERDAAIQKVKAAKPAQLVSPDPELARAIIYVAALAKNPSP